MGNEFGEAAETAAKICYAALDFTATMLNAVPPVKDKLPIPSEIVDKLPIPSDIEPHSQPQQPAAPVAAGAPKSEKHSVFSAVWRWGSALFGSEPEKKESYSFISNPNPTDLQKPTPEQAGPTEKLKYSAAFMDITKGALNAISSQLPLVSKVEIFICLIFSCCLSLIILHGSFFLIICA